MFSEFLSLDGGCCTQIKISSEIETFTGFLSFLYSYYCYVFQILIDDLDFCLMGINWNTSGGRSGL